MKGRNEKYVCPCCGYATLSVQNMYEICEICFWEDDGQDDPDADECWKGPNLVSLTDGRKNFIAHGVSDLKDKHNVREPTKNDEQVRVFKIKNGNVIES